MLQRPRWPYEGTAMGSIVLDLQPGLGIVPFALGLLSKLHAGIAKMLDEASEALEPESERCKDISSHFLDYISISRSLHELHSLKCMAQDVNLADQLGLSLGLLRKAKNVDKKAPKDYGGRHQA
ncbi:hypothetical protein Droror1_Dr00012333 [Drosera rotundifolia]